MNPCTCKCQGSLKGCAAGEGVRWDTAQLLASTTFKRTGSDVGKPAATGDHEVVLLADFYRAGDGIDESFTAQMIVSDADIAPDIPGDQNLWVQGWAAGLRWCTSASRSERVTGGSPATRAALS